MTNKMKFLALTSIAIAALTGCTSTPPARVAESAPVIESPTIGVDMTEYYIKDDGTLVAYNFEQAEELCLSLTDEDALSDCINDAIGTWCEFEPLTPDHKFYTEEDGRCTAEQAK